MKQFIVPPSETKSFSLIEYFLVWVEKELGIVFSAGEKEMILSCGSTGFIDGIKGWSNCDCRHLQFRPKGCGVSGCPNCIERANRALAQYEYWRWTNLFGLCGSRSAVDFITFTVSPEFYAVIAHDSKKFLLVCYESLCEYFGVKSDEELFAKAVCQEWGDEDISGEASPHGHFVLSPYVFEKKTHEITRRLPFVGQLINRNRLLQTFNRPLLNIFNRRMKEAFNLPEDSVVSLNVNRRFASESLSGSRVACAKLFHQLKYLYRAPITDVVKQLLDGRFLRRGSKIFVFSGGRASLVEFDSGRKGRLAHLIRESAQKKVFENDKGKRVSRREERVLGFGAASKRKVGLVLKALAAANKHNGFVYKCFSKWHREHVSSCWYHSSSHPIGEPVSMSRVEAIKTYGNRLRLKVTFLERKQVIELEAFDRSGEFV